MHFVIVYTTEEHQKKWKIVLEAEKSEIKVPTGLISGKTSLTACGLLSSHRVLTCSFFCLSWKRDRGRLQLALGKQTLGSTTLRSCPPPLPCVFFKLTVFVLFNEQFKQLL